MSIFYPAVEQFRRVGTHLEALYTCGLAGQASSSRAAEAFTIELSQVNMAKLCTLKIIKIPDEEEKI
jgi:hypothetical protein